MTVWVVAAAWLTLSVLILVALVAVGRAGHVEDVAHGYDDTVPEPAVRARRSPAPVA